MGTAFGTVSADDASSLTPSRCLIRARSVLPWDTTRTQACRRRSGTITSQKYGSRRAVTSRSDSPRGRLARGSAP
jgi:hypothetical protein